MKCSRESGKWKLVRTLIALTIFGAVAVIPLPCIAGPFSQTGVTASSDTDPSEVFADLQECIQEAKDEGESCFIDWDGHGRIKRPTPVKNTEGDKKQDERPGDIIGFEQWLLKMIGVE